MRWLTMVLVATALSATTVMAEEYTEGGHTNYLRGGYQYGKVLQTHDFFTGENQSGQPIDKYHAVRLEFGWQTGGDRDWHHLYNFPSYGIGFHYGDYFDEEELGKPTSLYGFFDWPLKRWGRRVLIFGSGFGLTSNWNAFDPDTNPYNMVIGAARSVYIDGGLNYEFPLSKRWWLQAGFSFTHYSNGGTQSPNSGVNQFGALAYVKYDLQERRIPEVRREIAPLKPEWELSAIASYGIRNLDLDLRDIPEYGVYLDKDYPIINAIAQVTRRYSHTSAWDAGLDLAYDGSVGDLMFLEAIRQGNEPPEASFADHLQFSVIGGYEHYFNRTRLIVQLGYTLFRKEVFDQVPRFYQRLGLKQLVFENFLLGLNVRLNNFSRANNLEFNIGYRFPQ